LGALPSRTWSTSTTPTPSGSCWSKTTPNTHTPASLYAAFAPAEARRLTGKLELHYTPKHGSWLNMAEIELAMLAGQCLNRRLADRATLEREVAAWQAARNRAGRGVNWRFTTEDARIKLKHLYPAAQG
jgi:DDE superfamily endonuclease